MASKIMGLLMTAGMNDLLFPSPDDACSCFVRNVNESG
jgi:hypothetical protein